MAGLERWIKEEGPRVRGSRPLDSAKVQAPGVVGLPDGGYRLFYTAVGPGKPFADCQGYILSAVSVDGIDFEVEPGIRVAPDPASSFMDLRVLAPTVTRLDDGRWRMYFEGRSSADKPKVIGSAISKDMLDWQVEEGVRLVVPGGVRAPRYLPTPDGHKLVAVGQLPGAQVTDSAVGGAVVATSCDGIHFELGTAYLFPTDPAHGGDFSAAEVVPPVREGEEWVLFFSEWADPPGGPPQGLPLHPSSDPDAVAKGTSANFAEISIASDLAGFRSRIHIARSADGINWERGPVVVEGEGYGGDGMDAVHAEDMSLIRLPDGRYRMYYAACDPAGIWLVASAVSVD